MFLIHRDSNRKIEFIVSHFTIRLFICIIFLDEITMPIDTTLFVELANPARLKILELLTEAPHAIGDLTPKMEVSRPEISRHVARLVDQGIAQQEGRKYTLASFGEVLVTLLAPLQFVAQYPDFFQTHRVELPSLLLLQINALNQAKLVRGVGLVMIELQELLNHPPKDDLYALLHQRFPLLRQGPKARCAYHIIPESLRANIPGTSTQLYATAHYRILPQVSHGIWLTTSGKALLCFPDLNNTPDYNVAFSVTDSVGLTYVKAIWEHFWQQSEVVCTYK
jgi:DNA-binding transcriptional ArsR family regulator